MHKLLTVKEVAEILQLSEYQVRNRLEIPYIDLATEGKKRTIRYREEDVENFIKKNKCYVIDVPKKRVEYIV